MLNQIVALLIVNTKCMIPGRRADAHLVYPAGIAYPDRKGNGGAYLRFVNRTTDEPPSGKYRVQMKGGYKIAIDVQVMYNNLRSYMEEKGIVKELGHGF
jgi:hypothetical protein